MNWRQRIDELEKGNASYITAVNDSRGWKCCAIGERREIIEAKGVSFKRDKFSYPNNDYLHELGCDFYNAIFMMEWNFARSIIDQIDAWIASHPTIKDGNETTNNYSLQAPDMEPVASDESLAKSEAQ